MLDPDVKSVTDQYINKNINRRSFLITAGVFTGSISLGGLLSYYYRSSKIKPPYSRSQNRIIQVLHEHLFPLADDSPGATDINSVDYLHFVLTDPEVDQDNKNLMINGIQWLEEECQSKFSKPFIDLTSVEKDKVLHIIEDSNWGYRFISLNLIYIFEALLSDPIYGGNTDEIGWKWLEHTPGLPRPTDKTKYGSL